MDHETRTLRFVGSRLKGLSTLIFVPVLIVMFGLGEATIIGGMTRGHMQVSGLGMVFGVVLAIGLVVMPFAYILVVRAFLKPNLLEISLTGFRRTTQGFVQEQEWASIGEPQRRLVSAGRGRVMVIDLPVLGRSARTVRVHTTPFLESPDDILDALTQARNGVLIEQPVPRRMAVVLAYVSLVFSIIIALMVFGLAIAFLAA